MSKLFTQLFNATRYSCDGFIYLLRSEFAARIEIYALLWMSLIYAALKVSLAYFAISLILFLFLIMAEAFNTAIEVVIDHVSPEISKTGKHAKDLGSFAVLCVYFVNMIFIAYVLFTADWGNILVSFQSNTLLLALHFACVMSIFFTVVRIGKTET